MLYVGIGGSDVRPQSWVPLARSISRVWQAGTVSTSEPKTTLKRRKQSPLANCDTLALSVIDASLRRVPLLIITAGPDQSYGHCVSESGKVGQRTECRVLE